MKNTSITRTKKTAVTIAVIIFWLLVWQLLSIVINSKILFASPLSVVKTLFGLIQTGDFWSSIAFSSRKIASGFLLGSLAGTLLAVLSYIILPIKYLISPLMKVIKAVPVASFIILAIICINTKNLSILISFIMVMPIFYANVLQGLETTNKQLLEMAVVFRMKSINKIRYIYLPTIVPCFISASSISAGFCWKSGVAAELIGKTQGSIGNELYFAKIYFETEELFAWTLVIVLISTLFEKIVVFLLKKLGKKLK